LFPAKPGERMWKMEKGKSLIVKKLEERGKEIGVALKKAAEAEVERILNFEIETGCRWTRKMKAALTAFEKA
jgi:hypothetical protein